MFSSPEREFSLGPDGVMVADHQSANSNGLAAGGHNVVGGRDCATGNVVCVGFQGILP